MLIDAFKYQEKNFQKIFNFFLSATFIAAVMQDFFMVVGGLYFHLGFGFHQNYLNNQFIYLYPLKIFKYLFFLIVLYLCLINAGLNNLKNKILIFLIISIPSIIIDITNGNYLLLILGFKAVLPVAAYYIGVNLNFIGFIKLYNLIKLTLWANLSIAFFQQFKIYQFMINNGARYQEYLGIRSGGTFLEPNTFGLYALSSMIFILLGRREKIIDASHIYIFISYFLILLSGSRTVLFSATLTLVIYYCKFESSYKKTIKNNFFITAVLLLFFILLLWGRGLESVFIRVNDFSQLLINDQLINLFFGKGFGLGTISSGTYAHIDKNFYIPVTNTDSQWIAFFVQGGYWALGLLAILFFYHIKRQSSLNIRIILINFFILGLGIQFIESWPFGFLTFLLIGFYSKKNIELRR